MLILAIETSCDETSAAVISADENDNLTILSNIISSQTDLHEIYGGVVPEIAARHHLELINFVIQKALDDAGCNFSDLNLVGVTYGPGLVSSLLIGIMAAKAISFVQKIPLVGVNHIEGHVYANFINRVKGQGSRVKEETNTVHESRITSNEIRNTKYEIQNTNGVQIPKFPFISLIVSGGHTELIYAKNHGEYDLLGKTRDDAAGEAFDKVARFMGLGYPGGPIIDELAKNGNPLAINFPRALLTNGFDFSFSGLKTAVVRWIEKETYNLKLTTYNLKNDIAASFQQAIIDVLVEKSLNACKTENVKTLVLAGGVAANSCLRETLEKKTKELEINFIYPPLNLCTDNAAMIGACAYHQFKRGKIDDFKLSPVANLQIA